MPSLNWLCSQANAFNRRIADAATLVREIAAWRTRRNNHNDKADWRFTTANARIRLKSLYPSL